MSATAAQPDYSSSYNQLPIPYAAGQYTNQKTATGIFSYTYIVSQTLINSLKYGYTRNWGQGFSLTQRHASTTARHGGHHQPALRATLRHSMPAVSFSAVNGPTAPTQLGSTSKHRPPGHQYLHPVIDNLTLDQGPP